MNTPKRIIVLGATGSIGTSCCDILANNPDRYVPVLLSAHSNAAALETLASSFGGVPSVLVSRDGEDTLHRMIAETDADIVVNGIAGSPGLRFSQTALETGKNLALANKETIVMAGYIIRDMARANGVQILPVDSEHSAIFSLIEAHGRNAIHKIILTASGGPFRTWDRDAIHGATVEQALRHPTWSMGAKITIDSASMANKGLEIIEAVRLFDLAPEQVSVVIHPQSLIHSLVQTLDGMLFAQISPPDMRHPIIAALDWPETRPNHLRPLDLSNPVTIELYPPRTDAFPMLALAEDSVVAGGSYTIAYNAANECAVAAFLARHIPFGAIADSTREVLEADWSGNATTIDDVIDTDTRVRETAAAILKGWHA